ncbi:LPS-assembly protein LptD [Vulgatibacter incomptus]|uniref:Outer membrane protein Imp n=1 Tax=Vulgatibacter incomptus TaxID=1391653 RepID=A0A0K1P8M0_9BACT|nr:LPS assembly protein LptD [Vulgatibacter incomptus]AKU89878.1 Outer membrane protein Imp [Vulgatibacter incomptus]
MRLAGLRAFLFVILLAGAAVARAQGPLPSGVEPETPVHLSADRLVRDESGVVEAEGNVRLMAGTLHLGADRVRYDPEAQSAELSGSVTLVDGEYVARAATARIDLAERTGVFEHAALFQKRDPVDPDAILAARDVEDVRRAGHNELEIHAERVARLADGSYAASQPSVTTCDCGDHPPDWRIGASEARLSTKDRLSLSWPVLYARGVPIFAAPYLSIPVTDERRSGLLFAVPHITGRRGASYEQPVYIVLGHSYDMTVSAGYYTGHQISLSDRGRSEKADVFQGPRGSLEFRYTPRVGTAGRAFVAYGYDLSKTDNQVPGAAPSRYAIQADHIDDWGGHFSDRLALNLVSDRDYIRDFVDDIVLRGEQTLRSTAWVGYRKGAVLGVAEGSFLQDLRPAFGPEVTAPPEGFQETLRLFGAGARNTFQRVPAVAMDVARIEGPLGSGLSLHLGAARFAPWTSAAFGDVGLDGLGPGDFGYPGPDTGEGDHIFERGGKDGSIPGEIPRATRLSIRPTASWPLLAGRYLSLTPYAGWREQLYQYGPTGADTGVAGWGLFGAAAHTELARTFSNGVRHAWIPKAELRRLWPGHVRNAPLQLPSQIYDELDILPLRATTQSRLSLASQLEVPGPGGGLIAIEAEAGQNFILAPSPYIAEGFATATARLWPVQLAGLAQWDPHRGQITEAVAEASISDRRGDQLRGNYRRLAVGASSRLLAGPDELFSDLYFTETFRPPVLQELEQIGAGATVVPFPWLTLSYDLLFLPDLPSAKLLQQRASVGLRSACDCWAGAFHFGKRRDEGLDFWVSFNLGRI